MTPALDAVRREEAATTPMRDMLRGVADELLNGWRARSEPKDGLASHQWGDEVSLEVGRIIDAALLPKASVREEPDRPFFYPLSENEFDPPIEGEFDHDDEISERLRERRERSSK